MQLHIGSLKFTQGIHQTVLRALVGVCIHITLPPAHISVCAHISLASLGQTKLKILMTYLDQNDQTMRKSNLWSQA